MSLTSRKKRKRQDKAVVEDPQSQIEDVEMSQVDGDELVSDASSYEEEDIVFKEWLDKGTVRDDGRIEHESFALQVGDTVLELSIGDTVWMREEGDGKSSEDYSSPLKSDTSSMIARLESIWEEPDSKHRESTDSALNFRARWFFKKQEVEGLSGDFTGPVSDGFRSRLTEHDLVMGNHCDDNSITTICGAMHVLYRHPDADDVIPNLPETTWISRYSMRFGTAADQQGQILVSPYEGENDEWGDFNNSTHPPEKDGNEDGEDGNQNDDVSRTSGSESDQGTFDAFRHAGALDEGTTTLPRHARVGEGFQAVVPEFKPNERVISRKPTLVWKARQMSQQEIGRFFEEAATILVPYLRKNQLVHEESYSPLPWDRVEEFVRNTDHNRLPTLSSIGTAAALTKGTTKMLRECDVDAIMKTLHECNYDTKATLEMMKSSPEDFLTIWNTFDRETFDAGFRRYAGSLRMIYKGLVPSKDFREVIDYHYRFKIPDQFRRFQEIKQEQAIRMMECIETKRNLNAAITMIPEKAQDADLGNRRKDGDWTKNGITDVTTAVEERRMKAKEVLLQIQETLGNEKMAEVVDVIKYYNEKSTGEMKSLLMDVLKDDPELQARIVEFLPKRQVDAA